MEQPEIAVCTFSRVKTMAACFSLFNKEILPVIIHLQGIKDFSPETQFVSDLKAGA